MSFILNKVQSKQNRLWVIAIGLVVFIGLTGLLIFRQSSGGTQKINPKKGPIVEAIYAIGTVTPRHQFHFKVGQVKTIQNLLVQEGQPVKKGQLLTTLADGIQVHAPFEGTVTSLPFNPGENVFQDVPIVVVEDLKDLYILATLEQQGALRVKKGLSVSLNFESFRDKVFSGIVSSIYPQKGQFMVRIEVKDLSPEILPGMTADLSIEIAKKDEALLIPILAINAGKVLIERNGKKQKVDVKIGSTDNEWAEILGDNLHLDDTILMKK